MGGEVVDPDLRACLRKDAPDRDDDDVNRIFSYLVGVDALTSARESTLRNLASTSTRYRFHDANDILYCRGEISDCWFILLSGSVFIDGSMFLPRSSFGRRTPGCGRRQNECIILEPSELLYVDYVNNTAAVENNNNTSSLSPGGVGERSLKDDDAAASDSGVDLTAIFDQLPPPQLPPDFNHHQSLNNNNNNNNVGNVNVLVGGGGGVVVGLSRTDSFLKRTSHASDTSSAYSGSDMMQSSLEDPVDPADVDLNGLVESFVDSDDEDLESLGSSLVYRDSVRDCLEKEPSDRTDDDVEILLDFMGHLPAFANMTNPVRRAFCACMVFAVIERAGTVVMNDGEELDSWSVILNGRVEISGRSGGDDKDADDAVNDDDDTAVVNDAANDAIPSTTTTMTTEYLDVGDSFGITPTTEKLYHKGVMKTLVDDCQFVCIAQTDYYRILHQGEENTRKHEEEGEVVMITEHRTLDRNRQGQIVIRGTPDRLTNYLVADHSSVDPTYVEDFLLTARTFLDSPQQLADRLIEWFQDPDLRAKATRVVLLWVNNHFNDFETDADLCDFLERFEDRLDDAQMQGQLRLLNIASAAKAHTRGVILKRSSRDEQLQFSVVGGREKGSGGIGGRGGVFISTIDRDSRAFEAGLKRGDQILSVNTQSFEHVSIAKATEILQGSTHLAIQVKTNFFAFKELLCSLDGTKKPSSMRRDVSLPRIHKTIPYSGGGGSSNTLDAPTGGGSAASPTRESRDATKKTKNKISNMFGKIINSNSSKSNLQSTNSSHLNDSTENLWSPTSSSKSFSSSVKQLSSSNPDLTADSSFFGGGGDDDHSPLGGVGGGGVSSSVSSEVPEFAVRVYRADQTCRYLLIHKETTAKEVVMLALKEFSIVDASSSDYSLCQVSVQDGGLIKHSRLPEILNDLAQRIPLNARYYIKSNQSTEQLVSDEVAAEMLKEANVSFLQLNPMEIAFQLTLQDFDIFSEIEPTEFIDNLFERDSKYGEPMLEKFEELVNKEMFWVSTEVTSETNRVNRSKILKHFVKIAKYCKQVKNFNSMFAILSGLGHGSVSRLRATWEKLPTKYSKLFSDLQEVMDPSRNMAKYRNLVNSETVQPPMIPFFPVVKKDLTFICLGNDSKIEGLINFEKLRMLAKEIRHVGNMCSSKYDAQAMHDYVNNNNNNAGGNVTGGGIGGVHLGGGGLVGVGGGGVGLNGMATLRRRGHPKRHSIMISAKKIYEESQMARKVRTYLANLKIVDDEDKLHEASVKLEPPLGMKRSDSSPAPTPVSRPPSSLSSTSGLSISSAGMQQQQQHQQQQHQQQQQSAWTTPRFGAQSPDAVRKLMSLSEGTKPSKHTLPPSANPSYCGAPSIDNSSSSSSTLMYGRPPSIGGPSPATSPMMFPRRPHHHQHHHHHPHHHPHHPPHHHHILPSRQHPSRQSGGNGQQRNTIPLSAESSSVNSFSALSIGVGGGGGGGGGGGSSSSSSSSSTSGMMMMRKSQTVSSFSSASGNSSSDQLDNNDSSHCNNNNSNNNHHNNNRNNNNNNNADTASSTSSRHNSFSSVDYPSNNSVGGLQQQHQHQHQHHHQGGDRDRDSLGSFGGGGGAPFGFTDSRRSSGSMGSSSFVTHSPPISRRHNSSSSSSFHPAIVPPPPPPAPAAPPLPPSSHLLPPPYPTLVTTAPSNGGGGINNNSNGNGNNGNNSNNFAHRHSVSAVMLPPPPPMPPSTPHPHVRRAPPDYTVAAQMAAQISHARQMRQLNSSRRSFQRPPGGIMNALPLPSGLASSKNGTKHQTPDVAYEGDEDEDSQVSAV